MEGLILERIALTESAVRAVEGLFGIFLQGKLDDGGRELRETLGTWASAE